MTKQTTDRAVKDEIVEEKLDSVSGGRLRAPLDQTIYKQEAALSMTAQQPSTVLRVAVR